MTHKEVIYKFNSPLAWKFALNQYDFGLNHNWILLREEAGPPAAIYVLSLSENPPEELDRYIDAESPPEKRFAGHSAIIVSRQEAQNLRDEYQQRKQKVLDFRDERQQRISD